MPTRADRAAEIEDAENAVVHQIERGPALGTIRFAVRTYRGRVYVDIRTWLAGDDGELFATRKGLSLPESLVGDLAEGVDKLQAALRVPA